MSSSPPPNEMHVRASNILRIPKVWLIPVAIAAVFVALMSAIYIGSVINPSGHLHSLPVIVVNEDTGANAHGQKIDIGAGLVSALEQTKSVTSRLALSNETLSQAQEAMNRGAAFAALVLPSTLSRSVVLATGAGGQGSGLPAQASVQLLENTRLGNLGVSLAAGVVTPAMKKISPQIATKVQPLVTPAAASNPVVAAQLANPVTLTTSTYEPLPDHSALGLSAFYLALLAIMAGFISATLINNSIDSALGYGATELGPRWKQRRPVPINRRQTLLVKWCAALVAAPVLTGVLVLVAVGLLHMYAPDVLLLWLLAAFASVMIAFGTLALLATFGSIGQLLAMILLVYLSLASSGGTVPLQALPGFFRTVANVEPLRNVLDGTRAIMYFGARGDAGLTHSLVTIGSELVFWAVVGLAVTSWYDHRKLYRIAPDMFGLIGQAIDRTVEEREAVKAAASADEQS
jgi:YhgE/Pip-like protein